MEENSFRFVDSTHKMFFEEALEKIKTQDVCHYALIYCLGISADVRSHIGDVFDFEADCVKPECLTQGWITSGSSRVVRMAFNLYCNGVPGIHELDSDEDRIKECLSYTVGDLFCCGYAPYFWEAVKLRYPEYTDWN